MQDEISLLQALKQGDMDKAKELLDLKVKLPKDLADYDRSSVFDTLIRKKAFDILDLLVANGTIETDIYEYDSFKDTIFEKLLRYSPVDEEYLAFMKRFLEKAESLNSELRDQTLIGIALESGADIAIIKCLVDAGCDLNYKNNAEENFIYQVVNNNALSLRNSDKGVEYLNFLIGEGLDLNQGNIVGTTPLQLAVDRRKNEYIDLLLENQADPNLADRDGKTPFYCAVVHQLSYDLYVKLAKYDTPNFDLVTKENEAILPGYMRMLNRASEKELDLLGRLLEDGADPYQTSPYYDKEKSALDWAAERSLDVFKTVVEKGNADINRQDNKGNTLLHMVCAVNVNYDQEAAKEIYRKVKFLLAEGADVSILNDKDQTALMLASDDNLKSKTVELLLQQ